ncbi:MAG: rod shape-determining protein MreC [Gallionellales bacterium RIFCSPLOWO2_12_FULL_59_22]|nr:MAG: rod shape-determining protein MreC [Gallionellales bacterium RIFCSPLOWO2_02_FULL_59_110]OGT10097.1 MAG: rod shape-determining protein MreC [Gallionellales bacterium RIFCSPLOWO2_12_FULL_59_22]
MTDNTQTFQFFNRGPSPAVRLVFFAVLSLLLLFVDARYRYLESTRSALSVLVSPIQRLATLPGLLWQQAGDYLATQHSLVEDNQALHRLHARDAAQLAQLQALQQENRQLRNLLALPQRGELAMQPVEVVYAERDVFKRKVLVDKGADAGVQVGQVVMDDQGIVGQITRVYPWLSEVTLVTEKDHAVPVQVLRNGLRTIVFGAGDTSQLSLRYMPVSSDIQEGDMLVTSGIDGIYPPGIPVARVVKIERDPAYPFARVTCLPVAGVDSHRHLLILSGPPGLPERPAQEPAATRNPKAKQKK